jgi:hypothetical protein
MQTIQNINQKQMLRKVLLLSVLLLSFSAVIAQKPKDTISTEVIEVVKPYVPTIADSFKINDVPVHSEEVVEKDSITYQINSVPVASTFTPNKGKAKSVVKPEKIRLYDNYIAAGFGNYTSPLLNGYLKTFPQRDSELGFIFNHHSSKGGIKEVRLADAYSDTDANVYYKMEDNQMVWRLGLKLIHGKYNYYGLPENQTFSQDLLNKIEPKHSYFGLGVIGDINFSESIVSEGKVLMSTFSDNFGSSEQHFRVQPKLELPIATERINFEFDLEYLKGNSYQQYHGGDSQKYKYFNLGVTPNFEILREQLSINLGVKLYFIANMGNKTAAVKAYPNVDASYQLIPEVLTVFAGAGGGIYNNTYEELLTENPYLSPTFYSVPTEEPYIFYGGLKGKIASNMGYLFTGSYAKKDNLPLMQLNPSLSNGIDEVKPYQLGNSFQILYDTAEIIALEGELTFDFSKQFTFGGNANMSFVNLQMQKENWNIPSLKANVFADYHHDKWKGVARLFMMTDRKDINAAYPIDLTGFPDVVTAGTYLDLNAEMAYSFSERLAAFAKANNLLTTHYKRYYNYPVQGLQIIAGITYKFDL